MLPYWIGPWALFVVAGIAVLLPLYAKLLNALRRHNPDEYVAIGSPTLFMASPSRGIRLQRFIYSGSKKPGIAPEVARMCGILGVLTPTFVVLVYAMLFWGLFNLEPVV